MKIEREKFLLYALTDGSAKKGEDFFWKIEKALKGGVTLLQLREKNMSVKELTALAKRLKGICQVYDVPLIINDSVETALLSAADGVHLGQGDMDIVKARRMLGNDKIIGVSAHSVEEALTAQENGADYLGCGAVFATGSKANTSPISYDTLSRICGSVSLPVVAIGGINEENIHGLSGIGICGVAVINAIFSKEDTENAARTLRGLIEKTVKR